MKPVIYGIRNCDTMKKARTWLETHGVQHEFHDYKTSGLDRAKLQEWIGKASWEVLLNRAGTTFRKLPEARKADLSQAKAIELMLEAPSMISALCSNMARRSPLVSMPTSILCCRSRASKCDPPLAIKRPFSLRASESAWPGHSRTLAL